MSKEEIYYFYEKKEGFGLDNILHISGVGEETLIKHLWNWGIEDEEDAKKFIAEKYVKRKVILCKNEEDKLDFIEISIDFNLKGE